MGEPFMSLLAPTLEAFFTDRLMHQRHASPNTVAAYRDTFRLLLSYLREATNKAPSKLDLQDLNAPTIGAFLQHLEIAQAQRRAHPQCPAQRHPFVLCVRRDAPPRTC